MKSLVNLIRFLPAVLLFASSLSAQEPTSNKKQIQALRAEQSIQIDARLSEPVWQAAPPAGDLIQLEPRPGAASSQRCDIRLAYDDYGLYIGALLYDSAPDSILKELTQRDQIGNADWFGIFIDSYRDGINGVGFIVSASGVQFDAKYSVFGEDENWDAVWESATAITPEGWIAEFKIPYSALRFPRQPKQTWHVNFGRLVQRFQEKSFWSPIDPQQNGFLNQAGLLLGIEDIEPPIRLQATPFIAFYGQHYHQKDATPKNTLGHSINGGLDLKYGISDAFTLDLTLIPDFGEARSDNQVLNLSPFEVRFEENRQFFTEGTELFNKGGLFYSRRIGGLPFYYDNINNELQAGEELIEHPTTSQMYNATKISGRNRKGLGLGFFNATTGNTYARIRNMETGEEYRRLSDPLTNYNVLVVDQNLKHNSYVSFINTTVLRNGDAYDANVSGVDFTLRDSANAYAVRGGGNVSQLYHPDSTSLGHSYNLRFQKTSGPLQFSIGYSEESNTYDPTDLGFLFNNNERAVQGWVEYTRFKPFWKFNRGGLGFWNGYEMLYKPTVFTSYNVEAWAWVETKQFWRFNLFTFFRPAGLDDYFEPRVQGRFLHVPAFRNVGFFIRSDERKPFMAMVEAGYGAWSESGRNRWFWRLDTRYRVNDHLTFGFEVFDQENKNDLGYVNQVDQDVFMGRRRRSTVENVFSTKYTFNNRMEITLRARHYWANADYRSFHLLSDDGGLLATSYSGDHNTNFNAFNVDMIYRWRFAPGSDIFFVWKNNVLASSGNAETSYFRNIDGLFDNPVSNSLSLKVVYFLDYLNFVRTR